MVCIVNWWSWKQVRDWVWEVVVDDDDAAAAAAAAEEHNLMYDCVYH